MPGALRARYRIFVHPVAALRGALYHWTSELSDLYYRIDTRKDGQEKPRGDYAAYDPVEPKYLRWAFRELRRVADFRDFTFVDFGSGKGRALAWAAAHGFREVVGVEMAEPLHLAAVANLGKMRMAKCQAAASVCMDAREFTLPARQSVLFFYNPFRGAIMEKVLSNIEDSLRANPRAMFLVYLNPVMHESFMQRQGMKLIRVGDWCNLYTWEHRALAAAS